MAGRPGPNLPMPFWGHHLAGASAQFFSEWLTRLPMPRDKMSNTHSHGFQETPKQEIQLTGFCTGVKFREYSGPFEASM